MPSSKPLAGHICLIAGLCALLLALPAQAFDPERDTWLLPPPTEPVGGAQRVLDPVEFLRMRATGNDLEPEYATPGQLELLDASAKGDRPRLESLLQEGINPNGRRDLWGKTALVEAVDRGDVEMVRLLLDAGADPDLKAAGYTPLGRAAMQGHSRIARMLLEAGADPDLKSNDGNTPLAAAAAMNRVTVIRVLMAHQPDYTLHNLEGRTALSVAALEGFEEAVRAMLEGGIDVNVQDRNKSTALDATSESDNKRIQQLLVDYGATTL
ncbi:MAG: ankyrin repeat domain-containing protein [Pseudomonadota bacterium]